MGIFTTVIAVLLLPASAFLLQKTDGGHKRSATVIEVCVCCVVCVVLCCVVLCCVVLCCVVLCSVVKSGFKNMEKRETALGEKWMTVGVVYLFESSALFTLLVGLNFFFTLA